MHPALSGLTAYNQFVVYKIVPSVSRPGKTDKFPCDYRTGQIKVDAHDPQYWTDADIATATAIALGAEYGVGFVFTENDPFFFLDIDGCLIDGQWSPLALSLCTLFAGCAIEISQSCTGLHIFGIGKPPVHSCTNKALGLEFYHTRRFAALTGCGAIGNCSADMSAVLPALVAQYFPPDTVVAGDVDWSDGPCEGWRGPTNDEDLIRRAMNSKSSASAFNGKASFADLWLANELVLAVSYPDPNGRPYDASGADAALAQHLAFWTGNDCERIERLMRKSQLVRDKWDSHDTYLRELTISRAVARQSDVLQDKSTPLPPAEGAIELKGIEASLLQLKTQDSVAQIFALKRAGQLLFNHSRSKWMEWDGTRWKFETTQRAFDFARDLARSVNWEGASSLGSASFCGGVEKFAQASRVFAVVGDDFDRDNYLLNTPAGTLDLRTGELREPRPEDRIALCTSVAPNSEGGEVFRKFLSEITLGDVEVQEFLQVSLGACLSGAVESHWMLFWIGQGRNGKNTLGDLVEDAMGDYARTVPTSTLMSKQNAAHPTELANLQGIRMALSSEVSDGEHWDESRIKQVTGDAKISGRFMRGDFFTFQRTHKHLIYGNHRPQLRSVDSAIKSRLHIVPFKASFLGREDAELPRKLHAELGYVLGWLIEGHAKWLAAERKLPKCAAVEAESADYFASQSTPEMWLAERTQNVPDQMVKSGDLYKDYAEWKKDRGEQPVSQTRWAETMQKRFEKVVSNFVRYRGLMLLPKVTNVPFPSQTPPQISKPN
jgi:putative DNA primase/helicase